MSADASKLEGRTTARPHDHAVLSYARTDELIAALLAYVDQGVERHEVTVFVHSFEDDEAAWSFLERGRPNVRRLAGDELVLVSLYEPAFERGGRIDHEHVAGVVGDLSERAAAQGRGLRIFVDASRRYLDSGRGDEWFRFEEWLGTRLRDAVALVCAYRAEHIEDAAVLENVLRTHAYRFQPPSASP